MPQFLSEGGNLSRVFKDSRPAKRSLLDALVSWAFALPLTGNVLPACLFFALSREALGDYHKGLLHPTVNGILKRKKKMR